MAIATDLGLNLKCFHCGAPSGTSPIEFDGKHFCCNGCKSVYQILAENELCRYYDFEKTPGTTPPLRPSSQFEFLNDPAIIRQLLDFSEGTTEVVTLHIPQMRCSSCIWLLEHLHRLEDGITLSRVDFLKKTLLIRYSRDRTSLRSIVSLLTGLGYEPELNLGNIGARSAPASNRPLYLKLGVAAFCFGNIMLFSLPEYLAGPRADLSSRSIFGIINLLLSLPVAFFSSTIFYLSAWQGIRKRVINIDVPIALGIVVVFLRSAVEVILGTGPGYFDSMTGLVFFLLIGRVVQNKTYESLNFERQFQSYFPLAATIRSNGKITTVPVTSIRPGDRLIIRNSEVVPADAVIMAGDARIDYSFVTGESQRVRKDIGEVVYAGGKQAGATIEVEAIKEVSQSKLVQLWSEFGGSEKPKSRMLTLSTTVGKYFTIGVLALAALTALAWFIIDPTRILDAVTAILIVACPCALALASPFSFSTTMRMFGNKGLFLKNTSVVEALSRTDTIVFDKTGTITQTKAASIRFAGDLEGDDERALIASLARSSTHPLSRAIVEYLDVRESPAVEEFEEIEGEGIKGIVEGRTVRLGSAQFVNALERSTPYERAQTRVYVSIDSRVLGWFGFDTKYRQGLSEVLRSLGTSHRLILLSGDGDAEEQRLRALYPGFRELRFNQKPADKLSAVRQLQMAGNSVLMIGDGLNDAGALLQSDVAIAVTEDISSFSPACDAILNAASFSLLHRFVPFTSSSMRIVHGSIGLSILYNLVGLWFAVQGALSPILAAILMPVSSISVVIFSTAVTRFLGSRKGLN